MNNNLYEIANNINYLFSLLNSDNLSNLKVVNIEIIEYELSFDKRKLIKIFLEEFNI